MTERKPGCPTTHFIILGHERCGSTMLMTVLAEHERIQMYGEIFHARTLDRKTYFPADRREYKTTAGSMEIIPGGDYYEDGTSGADFLERAVFYKRWRRDRYAVGFKLFYDHARNDSAARTAWDSLVSRKALRVLHLIRENPFHAWVSYEVARRSNQWCLLREESEKPLIVAPFEGDFESCRRFMRNCFAGRRLARRMFRRQPVMQIGYQRDLCDRFAQVLREIQSFLGVPYRKLCVQTRKQASIPSDDQISNFQELKARFWNTRFRQYLE
jgi:LPS sulfotransferase NodH